MIDRVLLSRDSELVARMSSSVPVAWLYVRRHIVFFDIMPNGKWSQGVEAGVGSVPRTAEV